MKRNDEKGVTLIELLAAITLLMIVLIPFTNLFFQGFKSNQENVKQLDTKIVATGIIEELKAGVREHKDEVEIGDEEFDISDPSDVEVTDHAITLNGTDFLLSFTIDNYQIPDSMIDGDVEDKPDNLYKISVTLVPQGAVVNNRTIQLEVIVKR